MRAAWISLLQDHIPLNNARILDAGCGTGSLSVLLAGLGHRVSGIDFSPEMITVAKDKAHKAGMKIDFQVMDAADPQLHAQFFDIVLSRHLLWALPEPARVLRRWMNLVNQGGYIIFIEGFRHMGGGLHLADLLHFLPGGVSVITMKNLSENPDLWAGRSAMSATC